MRNQPLPRRSLSIVVSLALGMGVLATAPARAADPPTLKANGVVLLGATISSAPFTVTLADHASGTTKVKFYLGTTYVGQDTSAPFTAALSPAAAGQFTAQARTETTAGYRPGVLGRLHLLAGSDADTHTHTHTDTDTDTDTHTDTDGAGADSSRRQR